MRIILLATVLAVSSASADAAAFRLERRGDAIEAFSDGRRFAVLSPAEGADWKLESDDSGSDFIRFKFSPRRGKSGTFRFPEIRLDADGTALKAVGSQGFAALDDDVGSAMYLAVADPGTRKGVVAAWLTSENGSPFVRSAISGGAAVLKPELQYGGIGASGSETFLLGTFDDCRLGLEAYGDAIAAHYAIRLHPQISGYTTWYDDRYGYSKGFGAGTPASAREFADAVGRLNLGEFGFSFFQIDDFWQDGPTDVNGPAKNFTRVAPTGPFAEGMKPTADCLRGKGILPGVWFMPFAGTQQDSWWSDKQSLFVRNPRTGKPYETTWGGTCLDMTNPDAVRYMQGVTRRICREWGYGYVKYDGMWMAMGCKLSKPSALDGDEYNQQTFFDPGVTGVGAYRRGVRAMRDAAGEDVFILACNLAQNVRAMGATYGLVDACRIGGDNGPIDMFPHRYMAGIMNGTPRYFLNGRVWYNDPDPVYVRDAVPLGRARMMATWTSIGGMLYNFSDWLPDLSAERVDILKRTMAPHGVKTVRPVDFFERTLANAWVLEKGDVRVFGLYNWSTNETLRIDWPAAYCGLDPAKRYVGFDFWAGEQVAPFAGRFRFDVPPDSCRVISVRECEDRPVLVSTSRHVASPAFEVSGVAWEGDSLRGESKVVAGDCYEMRLYVPAGWKVLGWTPDPGRAGTVESKGTFARLAYVPEKTGTIRWRVAFSRGGLDASSARIPEISWSIMHPTAIDTNYMARVAAKAAEYGGVDSFEVCGDCHRGYSGINGLSMLERYPHAHANVDAASVEKNRREMNVICEIAHAAGKPLYYWHREIFIPKGLLDDMPELLDADGEFDLLGNAYRDWLRYKLDETFRHCPGLDGIVLTLTEADYSVIHNSRPDRYPPQKVVEELVGLFAEEHEKRGKRFILRSFGSNTQDYIDIIGGAVAAAKDTRSALRNLGAGGFEIETKVTEADFVPWLPKNPFLKKNPPLSLGAECDALGEYLSAGYLPAAQVARIREYVDSARAEGADRYTIRIDRVGNSIFDSAHEVNLYAYMRFIRDPSATEDGVVSEYAAKRFGDAAAEMVPLLKGELEMIRNIHFVASNLVFHSFPLKANFKTVKAGGIFSVYRENSSLEATKDIWSILSHMKAPSHAQILAEKAKGLEMAKAGLAKVESLRGRMPAGEYALQRRAFAAAVEAAKALQAFAKCCVAYFEDMEARKDDPDTLRRASEEGVRLVESMMADPSDGFTGNKAHFSVVGDNLDRAYFAGVRYYCRELLNEYACERAIRRRYEARGDVVDFVVVGGIYDDNRTIRTMHGAYTKTLPGRVVRQAGNPIFPNGTISVRFRDVPGAKVEVQLDPSGSQEYTMRESVADGMRMVTVGKKGRDYPAILGIALVVRR